MDIKGDKEMKTIEEQIEVMQHYANGGEVEIFTNDKWHLINNSNFANWNFNVYDFRIKEQKKTVTIEKWLISYDDGIYQILLGNENFFKKSIHPQAKIKLLETYEVEL